MVYLSKSKIFIFQLIFLGIIIFEIAYNLFSSNQSLYLDINMMKYTWLLLFLFTFYISTKISNLLSVFSLFLITSFIFNYSRIFLDIFSSYNFEDTDLFLHMTLSSDTQATLLGIILVFLSLSSIVFILFYKKNSLQLNHDASLNKVAKVIVLFIFLPLVYNYLLELKYILQHGYLAIFTGELREHTNTILPTVLPRLLTFSYMLFLASIPTKKDFKKFTYIYIFIIFLNALKGQRGELLLNIIYVLWFYHNIYKVKFQIKYAVLILILILIFSQLISGIRSNQIINFWDIPYEFLRLNGISLNVTGFLIEYNDILKSEGVPYLFAPVFDYFYRIFIDRSVFYNGPSLHLVDVSNYLSYDMTYKINETAYNLGHGTGTSYLAEFYDLGGIGLGGLSFALLVYIILKWEYYLYQVRLIMFLSPVVLSQFIYMPRAAIFKIIDDIIIYTILYLLVILILNSNKIKRYSKINKRK